MWKGILLFSVFVLSAVAAISGLIAVATLAWDTFVWLTNADFKHTDFWAPYHAGIMAMITGWAASLLWPAAEAMEPPRHEHPGRRSPK